MAYPRKKKKKPRWPINKHHQDFTYTQRPAKLFRADGIRVSKKNNKTLLTLTIDNEKLIHWLQNNYYRKSGYVKDKDTKWSQIDIIVDEWGKLAAVADSEKYLVMEGERDPNENEWVNWKEKRKALLKKEREEKEGNDPTP